MTTRNRLAKLIADDLLPRLVDQLVPRIADELRRRGMGNIQTAEARLAIPPDGDGEVEADVCAMLDRLRQESQSRSEFKELCESGNFARAAAVGKRWMKLREGQRGMTAAPAVAEDLSEVVNACRLGKKPETQLEEQLRGILVKLAEQGRRRKHEGKLERGERLLSRSLRAAVLAFGAEDERCERIRITLREIYEAQRCPEKVRLLGHTDI